MKTYSEIRNMFAASALRGFLAAPGDIGESARMYPEHAAQWAFKQADERILAMHPIPPYPHDGEKDDR